MPDAPPAGSSTQPPDLIGVALGGLTAGSATGAAAVTVGLVVLRDRLTDILPLLLFAGIVVAVTVAWGLSAPIADWWRRGITAALAIFGSMMLTALTAPVDMLGGRVTLAGFALVLLLVAGLAVRYTRRSANRGE